MIEIRWVGPPRWWNEGRAREIRYVVIHNTEGHEGPLDAEGGAAYDKRRPDQVSCHVFVDTNSAVREVLDKDTAYGAFPKGNALGIQVETCHAGAWDLAEPNDAATFDNAAQVVAQLCLAHGIPARKLTVPEVRAAWYAEPAARPSGLCGHWDVTRAYPEDGGDHTDPGPTFPWDEFVRRVAGYMGLAASEEGTTMRYLFTGFSDLPGLVNGRVVATDGMGMYVVVPKGNTAANLMTAAGVGPITEVKASAFPGATFAQVFGLFTGGCDYVGGSGLAPFRQAGAAPGGPVVVQVSGTVSGSVGGSLSGSFSGSSS